MTNPYFFVSHKHADRGIALVLAEFIRDLTNAQADIHLSSSPNFQGPRAGKELNDELKNALASTDVLFLVYTGEDQDWSYCMWECGVATDPRDTTPTNVIVLQCGSQAPVVYGTSLRVDATSVDSLEAFVVQLATDATFVQGHDGPLTGYDRREERLRELAQSLHEHLRPWLERLSMDKTTRVTSPFVRVELPGSAVESIMSATPQSREDVAAAALASEARIESSQRVEGLFSIAIGPTTGLARLMGLEGQPRSLGDLPPWIQSIVRQVVSALREELRSLPWAPYESEGGGLHLPFVSAYRAGADGEPGHFDISFMPVESPQVLARDRMLRMEDIYALQLGAIDPETVILRELLGNGRSRIPIIDAEGYAHMIAHRSMIMEFVAAKSFAGQDTAKLSLRDLLNDEEMAKMFESTFGTVAPDSTLEEARDAMARMPGCQDVFVTENGSRNAPVLGWLTNVMFVET